MAERLRLRFLPYFLIIALLSACAHEEIAPDDHHGVVRTIHLQLAFLFVYGTHDYELASEYTDVNGVLYKLDRIRFLLSDLHVIDNEENVLATYPGRQLLVDAAQPSNTFTLGALTASHAHQVRFTMGLNDPLNHADPDTCAAPMDDTTMHWGMGANEGYWFMVLEGRVDSDNSGVVDAGDDAFTYKCGTDALVRNGWAIMHTDLPDGGIFTVEIPVDVERLMGGVDVLNNLIALGDAPLNVQLMDSLHANFQEGH